MHVVLVYRYLQSSVGFFHGQIRSTTLCDDVVFDCLLVLLEGREQQLHLCHHPALVDGEGEGEEGAKENGGSHHHCPPREVGEGVEGLEGGLGSMYDGVEKVVCGQGACGGWKEGVTDVSFAAPCVEGS